MLKSAKADIIEYPNLVSYKFLPFGRAIYYLVDDPLLLPIVSPNRPIGFRFPMLWMDIVVLKSTYLMSLPFLFPIPALIVRRLRDAGGKRWMILLLLVPLITRR